MTPDPDHPQGAPSPPRRSRPRTTAVATTAGLLLALSAGCAATPTDLSTRQAQVAEAGSRVMPFDLDRTTHVFADQPDGGRQTVTADTPTDTEQITLIRQHLQSEADRFRRADFGDPATIHGDDMPGLTELRDSAGRIEVTYDELDNGAQLTYRTGEPAMVAAIHAWFAAQTGDHGGH